MARNFLLLSNCIFSAWHIKEYDLDLSKETLWPFFFFSYLLLKLLGCNDLEIEINKSMPLNYRRERRSVTQCYVFPSSPLEGWLQGKGESWGLAKCVTDEAGLSYQRCSCQFPTEKWWWGIGNSSFIDVCVLIKTSRLLIYRWLLTSLGAVSVSEITFELEIVLDFTFCSRD